MQSVIVPLDGSTFAEQAIPVGERIARLLGWSLELVRVNEIPLTELPMREHFPELDGYLREVAERTADQVPTTTLVLQGDPADEILQHLRGREASVVVMSTHGRSGLARLLVGSVAERIIGQTTVPIVLVRHPIAPEPTWPAGVVVPLDGSQLSELALPQAARLAEASQGSLHVVRVIDDLTAIPIAPIGGVAVPDEEVINRHIAQAQSEAEAYLAGISSIDLDQGVRVVTEVRSGKASDEILALADEVEADLIVMSTHGRTGWRRIGLGSVASDVVRDSRIPVMVLPVHEEEPPNR